MIQGKIKYKTESESWNWCKELDLYKKHSAKIIVLLPKSFKSNHYGRIKFDPYPVQVQCSEKIAGCGCMARCHRCVCVVKKLDSEPHDSKFMPTACYIAQLSSACQGSEWIW